MNSRSPKIPAKLPSSSTAGRAGSPESQTRRAATMTTSSADSGSTGLRMDLTIEFAMGVSYRTT
jgi:hypothetical protein